DWIDFHPKAREVLDSPFYWECGNDFAPNGNDTGADVLHGFRKWRMKNVRTPSRQFFQQLMRAWEVNPKGNDDFSVQTFDQSAIGLAFAHLKFDAACPKWLKDTALAAVKRQRDILVAKHREWTLF